MKAAATGRAVHPCSNLHERHHALMVVLGAAAITSSAGLELFQQQQGNFFNSNGRVLPPQVAALMPTTSPPPKPPEPPWAEVFWVEQTTMPPLTTPPVFEQCFGCGCIMIKPHVPFIKDGKISDDYTCIGGPAKFRVPEIHWWSQLPDELPTGDGGPPCKETMSYAITMEDLDFPLGKGESQNHVEPLFWAVNIPGSWSDFSDANAFTSNNGVPIVTMMKNHQGQYGMDQPCPKKGVHRYKLTLWALGESLGTQLEPLNPAIGYQNLLTKLASCELARTSLIGSVKGVPDKVGPAFLQRNDV